MKYILIFIFFANGVVYSQQIDENTMIINNYFNTTNEISVLNNSNSPNSGIKSFVKLVQKGDNNETYVNSLQTNDSQVVHQKGNQNKYEYYNYYSQENSNLIINQEGNQNSLQIFGENSLMKNAVINQKSDFKSIVIKNYTN